MTGEFHFKVCDAIRPHVHVGEHSLDELYNVVLRFNET